MRLAIPDLFAKCKRQGVLMFAVFVVLLVPINNAYAACCKGCPSSACSTARSVVRTFHNINRALITYDISSQFADYRTWWTTGFFKASVLPGLMMMTQQASAVAAQQGFMVGTFLDAQQQLRAQRDFQLLEYNAYKDYQPSEALCSIGSNVRSLADSRLRASFTQKALVKLDRSRLLGTLGTASGEGADKDLQGRWKVFRETYCDPRDNGGYVGNQKTGLYPVCARKDDNAARTNVDIDYTRLIENARTLDMDFANPAKNTAAQDVIALVRNLYADRAPQVFKSADDMTDPGKVQWYLAQRALMAQRGVAENSFAAIVGLKSAAPQTTGEQSKTRETLGAIMTALGVPKDEVFAYIGENPSHYAQMEILSQKIFQTPGFFAGLVDKPANVERQGVALQAIDLMMDRSVYETELRQEMTLSVMLSAALRDRLRAVQRNLPQGTAGGGGG